MLVEVEIERDLVWVCKLLGQVRLEVWAWVRGLAGNVSSNAIRRLSPSSEDWSTRLEIRRGIDMDIGEEVEVEVHLELDIQ